MSATEARRQRVEHRAAEAERFEAAMIACYRLQEARAIRDLLAAGGDPTEVVARRVALLEAS